MPKYIVTKREVWTQMVSVEASSEAEATRLVARGEGTTLDNTLEFSHDADEASWTVEEDDTD